MTRASLLVRGIVARGGLSLLILVVAVVAAAAAATGPTFYRAARYSILADAAHQAPTVGQGMEVTSDGQLSVLDLLTSQVAKARGGAPGADLLRRTVRGQEVSYSPAASQMTTIAWRDGLCSHLVIRQGHCARARGDMVVSAALARLDGIRLGDPVTGPVHGHVVGIYDPVRPRAPYWFNRAYFAQETPAPAEGAVDALFTVRDTFAAAPPQTEGVTVVDLLLDVDAVTPDRTSDLRATVSRLSAALARAGASATTGIPAMLDQADASSRALAVPVVLITAQLLGLVWLLLFLTITDAAEARGPEVALAKLRGVSRLRMLWVGVAEPVTILLAALPLGVVAGWAATSVLAGHALRPDIPVDVHWTTVVAALLAVSGGLVATLLAARRTVSRPVLDQWRRTGGGALRRGWVLEAGLLVATLAGLVELYTSGAVGSASAHVFALLVPGLLGLGIAVLASRALPWACRAVLPFTRRHGRLGGFLAVRQVARRPVAMRTLMLVTAAFALATFAISAWAVNQRNVHDVAATQVGAAAVLDVLPRPGQDLAAVVDRLDPQGRAAMAVESYTDFTGSGRRTLAVESKRLARIVYWRDDFSTVPLSRLAGKLAPPAPAPLTFDGDRIRLRLADVRLEQPVALWVNFKLGTTSGPTPVDLGTIRPGTRELETRLPPCPCTLRDLTVTSPDGQVSAAAGHLTVTALEVHSASGWRPVPAGLRQPHRWAFSGRTSLAGSESAVPVAQGLQLRFEAPPGSDLSWAAYSWPHPLPALVTGGLAPHGRRSPVTVTGVDGNPLRIVPVAAVPVPGAPDNGVMVDRSYALRAGYDAVYSAAHQVWLAPGAVRTFPDRLRRAGVSVLHVTTADGAQRQMLKQGPSLALLLFLADAAAAALLAAAGAVTGLQVTGRRRRYELAALLAHGARRRTLGSGLVMEQALTLGVGVVAGVGAGLVAVALAMPAIPEFITTPSAPALVFRPDWLVLTVPMTSAAIAVVVASLASASLLVARARTDQLREGEA